ncbi:MAG: hypothetical protein JWR21_2380 [Herminiimonas sp.]|nr:hypothetical protein [Herminiimonas sp.]
MDNDKTDFNALFAKVPTDFPRPVHAGAVSGFQNKLLLVEYEGKLYESGSTPPEIASRWDVCEDLAIKLQRSALESSTGKRAHMSKADILEQYRPRLIATGWTSEAEARWIIRRMAELLGWPVPEQAVEPDSGA